MLGRFLYGLPLSPLGTRDSNPPEVTDGVRIVYGQNVRRLLDLTSSVPDDGSVHATALRLSAGAFRQIVRFSECLEPKLAAGAELGSITDWAGKMAGAVVRISGLLHFAERVCEVDPSAMKIDEDTVHRAIAIGEPWHVT